MNLQSAGAFLKRLRTAFPDRELIMRSQGQVRFIRISSRLQVVAAASAGALAIAWGGSLGAVALAGMSADAEQAALQQREAEVARAENRVARYRSQTEEVASDLAQRQKFIEKVVEAHIGDLPEEGAAKDAAGEADDAQAAKISANMPQSGRFAHIEAAQLAFVERLTRYAEQRADSASNAIRKLGLNPRTIAASQRRAQGGPLVKLATSADGSVDPRFKKLGTSLERMEALENGLASIPQYKPAHVAYVSSSYGYRSDPFTGGAAFHAGLDFPGPMGSPIYAAAKGRVSFVGRRHGYGNCIEISHGNGLMTRYAHLSKFDAHVGEKVEAGTPIAAMGSTGRSTGPHLHFEVRVNGKPVNPRPFLEASRNVHKENN
ncbi:peptidoglycan DD-metalloendopeptidase family protein [Novosphingobium sp. YJ-S2-02]|uniref:Peptidoglycan DD-metalloendopeptidase family protein n=1 Tax=Novosphingobium aureum TaxID=2792964 RepID=A0A931MJJ9_9SPHN|nr:M23 family metallopeptidase [Novosphingobium aureum]MBH0111504.1 peptidoglycan DD-metalloendopeptidase family protein [Novosphingobium aureum]